MFAPVARWDTICPIIVVDAVKSWNIFQLDIKSTFLHGELNEEVFVQGEREKVSKLNKTLNGPKQAPRDWYSRIEAYFCQQGFEKCPYDHTLFVKDGKNDKLLIVSLYVDDRIFTGNDESMFKQFKESMIKEFEMTDLRRMKYFLGIEVIQDMKGVFICQQKYAKEILERFGMENSNSLCNPIVTSCKLTRDENGNPPDATVYKQLVRSLMYLIATRLDLMFVVCLISRFMERPTEIHMTTTKRVLRYVN